MAWWVQPHKVQESSSHKVLNNAFYAIFIPLHHSSGFSNMILELRGAGSLDPLDPPELMSASLAI